MSHRGWHNGQFQKTPYNSFNTLRSGDPFFPIRQPFQPSFGSQNVRFNEHHKKEIYKSTTLPGYMRKPQNIHINSYVDNNRAISSKQIQNSNSQSKIPPTVKSNNKTPSTSNRHTINPPAVNNNNNIDRTSTKNQLLIKNPKFSVDLDNQQIQQNDKSNLSTQFKFSMSASVLTSDEALNISHKRKNSHDDSPVAPKKRNVTDNSSNDTNTTSTTTTTTTSDNPHLVSLQSYNNDLALLKDQIKAQLKLVRDLKVEFDRANDQMKEMKVKRKSLLHKVKKICRAVVKEDKELSDISDCEVVVGAPNEIIDLETSSSDSRGSDSDSSDGVVFVATERPVVTTTAAPVTVPVVTTTAAAPVAVPVGTTAAAAEVAVPVVPTTTAPMIQTETVMSTPSGSLKKAHVKCDPTKLKIAPIVVTPSPMTKKSKKTVTPLATPLPKIPLIPSISKSYPKMESHMSSNKSFVLTFPTEQPDLKEDLRTLKADADNGLFNAIEPTLSPIVVGDDNKCFVTDIKIFNNRLFVSASHGLLKQYDLRSHECIVDYLGHTDLIHCILPTAHPVGLKRLISGGFDQKLLIHNIDSGALLNEIATDRPILCMCDLLDHVYVGDGGGNIMAMSLHKDKKVGNFQASQSGISCLCATKESNRHLLFVGTNSGEYSVWDALTFMKIKVITPLALSDAPIGFVMLQKQRVLAFTKNHVHFIYYAKVKNVTSLNHFSSINSMCLTKNYAIVGGLTGNISVYRLKGSVILKNPIKSLDNAGSPILSLTFYNNTIITGNKNGKIHFNRLVES